MDQKTQESAQKLEAKVAALKEKRDSSSDNSFFTDEKPESNNSDKPAPNRKRYDTTKQ